jgi:hypothetical protein
MAMPMKKPSPNMDKMCEDLMNHFGQKLNRLMSDTAHTCQAGGLKVEDCLSLILAPLMKETVKMSMGIGMDSKDFVKFATVAYQRLEEEYKTETPDNE